MKVHGPTPVYTGPDPDLMVISKKLSKKNSSTRNKALSELRSIIENRIEIISPEFIAFFVFIYERLLLDNDRFVRQETNSIFALLLKFDRKQFKLFIPTLVGPMWISTCDPFQEVDRSAEEVLESAFPNAEKRMESLSLHFRPLIRYVGGNISTSPETLSDMSNTSVEEADERYERVVTSALLSFAKLVASFPQDIFEQVSFEKLIRDSILPLSATPRHEFRKAVFRIFINLCEHRPSLISTNNLEDRISIILIRSLSTERASGTVAIMLHAIVSFLKAFPSALENIDLASHFFPQIQELLLSSSDLCLPALLPLISTINLERLVANKEALITLLTLLTELPQRMKDPTTPWITSAEISVFLAIRFLKHSEYIKLDEPTSTVFLQILDILNTALVTLMRQNESNVVAPLITHLQKQTLILKNQNNYIYMWNQSLAKSIHSCLLETVHLGISGNFLRYLNSAISLLSGISRIDYSSFEVAEKDLCCFSILSSIFRLADTHCRVLSSVLNHQSYGAQEGYMLWGSAGLRVGSLLLDILRSHPHLLSITLEDLISFVNLQSYYLCLNSYYDISISTGEYACQFRYSLDMFHDLHVFLLKISCLETLPSSGNILSAAISMATQNQSLLWAILLFRDNIVTSWDQLTLLEPEVPTVSWLKKYVQGKEFSQEFPVSLQIALVLCCKRKEIITSISEVDSTLNLWVEISEYYQTLDHSPSQSVISSFHQAFFLDSSSTDQCQILSEEFKIVSSWKVLSGLGIPDSHARKFVRSITSTLKGVLFGLIDPCSPNSLNAETFYFHFVRLIEQVQVGCLKSVSEQLVYDEIGVFDIAHWNQLYVIAKDFLGPGGDYHENRMPSLILTVKVLNLYFSHPTGATIDPMVSFLILRTLALIQSSERWTNLQKVDVDNVTNHTILCLVASCSPWLLRKILCECFGLHLAEIDAIFSSCTQVIEHASTRENQEVIFTDPLLTETREITKGMKSYYLSRTPIDSESSYLITPVEVTLLHFDDRVGETPFYTLGFLDGREIQTERFRVLFPSMHSPIVHCSDLIQSCEDHRSRSSHGSDPDSDFSQQLLDEMTEVLFNLVSCIGNKTSPTYNLSSFRFMMLVLRNLPIFHFHTPPLTEFVGCVRDAIIRLLNCHSIGEASFVHCGLDLLETLCRSIIGRGSGFWIRALILPIISQIFHSVKTAKLVLSLEERKVYLAKILSPLNLFLEAVPSFLLVEIVISVLDFSLLDIDLSGSELQMVVVNTVRSLWSCKCFEPALGTWVNKIFRMCVSDIVLFSSILATQALELAFQIHKPSEILSILESGVIDPATEDQACKYLSSNSNPFRCRVAIFMIMDVWFKRRRELLDQEIDASLDDEVCGRILLQRALGPYLDSFEAILSLWDQRFQKEISLDSLYWCVCGHNESAFCPHSNTPSQPHTDFFGILFNWLLILQMVDSYCASVPWGHRALIGPFIAKSNFFQFLMRELVGILMSIQIREFPATKDLSDFFFRSNHSTAELPDNYKILMILYTLSRTICLLPAASRTFYLSSCTRAECGILEKFVENYINERIIRREASIIEAAQSDSLNIRCSVATGEITTTYLADEVSVEMAIKLPKLYPLRNVEVECQRRMGINEGRWRRWTLQVNLCILFHY